MSFGPAAPDPNAQASAQAQYNTQAATQQQKLNMVNQTTPFGNYTYTPDANAPGGYTANMELSPAEQSLLTTQQQGQQIKGDTANQLLSNISGLYGSAPNLDISAMISKVMGWGQDYMQPIFNQQQSNLDAQLRNQGIAQGDKAWNDAQNLQSRNVDNAYISLLMQAEPQAFNQAVTQYQLPLSTTNAFMSGAQPTMPSLQSTPQESVAAPNFQQASQNQYLGNTASNSAQNQGLFGMATMLAGLSDRRAKTDIHKVGSLDNGLAVYVFRYKWGGPMQIGLMADEVEKLHPAAVHEINSLKHVDYGMAVT